MQTGREVSEMWKDMSYDRGNDFVSPAGYVLKKERVFMQGLWQKKTNSKANISEKQQCILEQRISPS